MLHTSSRRLGAAVAATALGAGALVTMAAPAANAATVDTTYTCNFPGLGAKDIPVQLNATLPPEAPAGFDAPAIPVLLTVTLPGDVVDAAKGLFQATAIGGFSNDMIATLTEGTSTTSAADLALLNAKFPAVAVPATANTPLTITTPSPLAPGAVPATTTPVSLPGTGTYGINVPSAFKFTATKQGDAVMLADVPCALKVGSAASLGSITLAANDATVTGKAKKVTEAKKAKAKVVVKVTADNEDPTGKVTAMIGQKKVGKANLNAQGKAVVKIKAKFLKVGKNKIKLTYAGDDFTDAGKSKSKVVLKVTK